MIMIYAETIKDRLIFELNTILNPDSLNLKKLGLTTLGVCLRFLCRLEKIREYHFIRNELVDIIFMNIVTPKVIMEIYMNESILMIIQNMKEITNKQINSDKSIPSLSYLIQLSKIL